MEWIQGSHVARGATAVVTRSLPGTVVKTLDAEGPVIAAKLEAAGTRAANDAGLPSPKLHEFDEGPPARLVMYIIEGQRSWKRSTLNWTDRPQKAMCHERLEVLGSRKGPGYRPPEPRAGRTASARQGVGPHRFAQNPPESPVKAAQSA